MQFLTHMVGMAAEGLFGDGMGFVLVVIAPERNAEDDGDELHMLLSANMQPEECCGVMSSLVNDYATRGVTPCEVETVTRNEIH